MVTEITYQHFCNLGALCNPGCSTQWSDKKRRCRYYYFGNLADACWMGWNHKSPGMKRRKSC